MLNERFPYFIRKARKEDWDDAMAVAWKTFLKFEAEDYTKEGIRNFFDFITDSVLYRMFLNGIYHMFVAEVVGGAAKTQVKDLFGFAEKVENKW